MGGVRSLIGCAKGPLSVGYPSCRCIDDRERPGRVGSGMGGRRLLVRVSRERWDVGCDLKRDGQRCRSTCLEDGSPTSGRRAARSGEAASSSAGAPAAAVGQESEPRCYRAAALLARLALGRESSDNISVVVIDLKGRG
uniref:protein-serine/threonine phosphatase n=1 Tax=Oryza sativa subsp. japonica TaxID=39947 RepID=Q7X6Y2_ORYSJ|nr:OSJNBb0115I21.1 [Oryza sativa Japonica Group]